MIIADFVAISIVVVAGFIGYKVGVGRVLQKITGGLVGKIISVVVCYFIYGLVLELPFVKDLLDRFVQWVASSNSSIVRLLLYVRIDMIAYFLALYIVVQLMRKMVIALIGKILSLAPLVDKTLGVTLNLAFAVAVALIVMQLSFWIFGADGGLYGVLDGSLFGLDKLYLNNPLNSIIESLDVTHVLNN